MEIRVNILGKVAYKENESRSDFEKAELYPFGDGVYAVMDGENFVELRVVSGKKHSEEKGDYYEWNMDISETVTLNEEYKSQDEAEQDRIFASIRKEAYDITSSVLEETFPKYYKYYDMADDVMSDDWDKLKKIYGNGVFHRGEMKLYIGTENEERLY